VSTLGINVVEVYRLEHTDFVGVDVIGSPGPARIEVDKGRVVHHLDLTGEWTRHKLSVEVDRQEPFVTFELQQGTERSPLVTAAGPVLTLADVYTGSVRPPVHSVVIVPPGRHIIATNLELAGVHLRVEAGATLAFGPDAGMTLRGGSVKMLGTEKCPIVLEGADATASWRNVQVSGCVHELVFRHCTFRNARAAVGLYEPGDAPEVGGGAMCLRDVTITRLEHCRFEACIAGLGGAILVEGGAVSCADCHVVDCKARLGGGVALVHARTTITGTRFEGNQALEHGGALHGRGSLDLNLKGCLFERNIADATLGRGGAISLLATKSTVLRDNTFDGNNAAMGVDLAGAMVTLQASGTRWSRGDALAYRFSMSNAKITNNRGQP
jgi:predicted outer membrane repeat protein